MKIRAIFVLDSQRVSYLFDWYNAQERKAFALRVADMLPEGWIITTFKYTE